METTLNLNYTDLEGKFKEFWDRLGKPIPKNSTRVLALAMLDSYFGVDNLRALKRVYNRIRHCRHTLFITTNQALDLLEDSYTYTPSFNELPLEFTIDDGKGKGKVTELDALALKKYEIEKSASIIAEKIKYEQLTKRLFATMPVTRYNALKIAVLKLLSFYDKELNGDKLSIDERKQKKSLQEKVRTYLIRWYKIRPTVNYDFCVSYWEAAQKYETGLYDY